MDIHFSKILHIGEFDFALNFKIEEDFFPFFLQDLKGKKAYIDINLLNTKIDLNEKDFFKKVEEKIILKKNSIFIPRPPIPQTIKIAISNYITFYSKTSFILHSGGITGKNNFVNLFIAESGGGKSTLCTFLREKTLNDDILIITKQNGKFYAQTTPFGFFNKIECRIVDRIFYLIKSKENKVKKIDFKEGIKLFLKNVPKNSNYNLILEFLSKKKQHYLYFSLNGRKFIEQI